MCPSRIDVRTLPITARAGGGAPVRQRHALIDSIERRAAHARRGRPRGRTTPGGLLLSREGEAQFFSITRARGRSRAGSCPSAGCPVSRSTYQTESRILRGGSRCSRRGSQYPRRSSRTPRATLPAVPRTRRSGDAAAEFPHQWALCACAGALDTKVARRTFVVIIKRCSTPRGDGGDVSRKEVVIEARPPRWGSTRPCSPRPRSARARSALKRETAAAQERGVFGVRCSSSARSCSGPRRLDYVARAVPRHLDVDGSNACAGYRRWRELDGRGGEVLRHI